MIRSFKCKDTERLFNDFSVKRFERFEKQAHRALYRLATAARVEDLNLPPGNRLEKLTGNRKGQYSIRINDRWRLCFVWNEGAENVEITDHYT